MGRAWIPKIPSTPGCPRLRPVWALPWGREGAVGTALREAPPPPPRPPQLSQAGRILQSYKETKIKNKHLAKKGLEGQR